VDPAARNDEQSAQWLLAQLLSWHRREDKRAFGQLATLTVTARHGPKFINSFFWGQ
jgi:hypothetical protein